MANPFSCSGEQPKLHESRPKEIKAMFSPQAKW